MKNKAKLFGIYLPIYVLTSLTAVVMRTLALFLDYDHKSGYFDDKVLIEISNCILIAAVVFYISYIFTSRRDLTLLPDFTSAATYVPVGTMSVAAVFMTVWLFIRSGEVIKKIEDLKWYGTPSALAKIPSLRIILIILIAAAVFSILSIIHLALTALVENHSSTKRANFGLCTVIFFSLYSLYLYFSTDLPINAPNKQIDQLTYLFTAVFFLYETRLSFGRERWRHYISFGFIASAMCAYSAIPSLIYYAASGNVTQNSIYELALTVATFIFITSRVFLTGNLIENKTSPTAIALMTASDLRDKEINPIPEKPEVIDVEGESLEPMIPEEDDTNQISLENEEMGISGEMLNNLEDEASEANIEVKSDDNESEITSES